MSVPDPSSVPLRRALRRVTRLGCTALLGLVAFGSACAEDPPPPVSDPVPDGGTPCERGTQGCACIGGSGCRDELLCIAGRCLLTQEAPSEPETPRPPLPRPPPLVSDAGSGASEPPALSPDAGDAGLEDAGADASP